MASAIKTTFLNAEPLNGFGLENIPFGIFAPKNPARGEDDNFPRAATKIGSTIINLHELAILGYFEEIHPELDILFGYDTLNEFIGLGKEVTGKVREHIQALFSTGSELENHPDLSLIVLPENEVNILMPLKVNNYTDFYSGKQHAFNVGTMFRGPENALMPNYLHLPVAYHGRANTIVVDGTNIRRPWGQIKPTDADSPIFTPSRQLDFELEMAFVVGKHNEIGQPVTTKEAEEHIFGFLIFNDWSARDIQAWEYQPLGPFLAKNFASSISPWIVVKEALAPFRIDNIEKQVPAVLPYLEEEGNNHYDIHLEITLQAAGMETPITICESNTKYLYWSVNQQLAHHTVNGCSMEVGDLCASGTISSPEKTGFGSMLELTWRGKEPITLPDGTQRSFLHDGDTIEIKAFAQKNDLKISFGSVKATILPAIENKWQK